MKKLLLMTLCLVLFLSAALAEALPADAVNELDLPHLDYADTGSWCYWAEGGEQLPADLFIVAPTVDMGKAGNLLGDMNSAKYLSSFTGALNMELGIYDQSCVVYAPYYQQATFPVYSMSYEESEAYFDYAYEEVRSAFLYYLAHCDAERPLVLAGFSQGADMALRLTKEFFGDEALMSRLVAVYAIGWRVTEMELKVWPHLHMAQEETDTGVIVAFNSEAEYITDSTLVPAGVHTYAINPLNWRTDDTAAGASLNLGACFTTYDGEIANEIDQFCGAYLDSERGTLKVPGIDDAAYPGAIFPDGVYHIYDYQFFYRNLQKNVQDRVAAFMN